MKIVVLLSQKGGTGKSTMATHLAVCAARDGKAVAFFDIDPQASAAKWSDRRTVEGPPVVRAGAAQLPNLVPQAREQGADVILIDTAGHADVSGLHALQLADLVLIPCRPSAADLDAIEDPMMLAQRAKQSKAAVVINAAPMRGHLTEDARAAISERIAVRAGRSWGKPQNSDAQFIALCRRSKWSKYFTRSPLLALVARAGSSAARKINSACPKAFC